eukprot:gnl/MRDRNA2_/MRDRNA2_98775_c0_seq1.p1 gnl/MRDRNA2_/MRDRNA2_98775_c0~~gnl/MRDRNA2_/MRDRNA2_98775_c0_seq1.p1  ORF type:complete len:768 (+),score=140.77 gnl/MRDRNA2_/MRDRNA2_98775_c0_seq1:99-2402(+)
MRGHNNRLGKGSQGYKRQYGTASEKMQHGVRKLITTQHLSVAPTSSGFVRLRSCLCELHGSILRGWRNELDPDGDLCCQFDTFCSAAKHIKFDHDVLDLFQIDPATVFFKDVDPHACALLLECRQWIQDKFGGTIEFFEAIDTSGDGQISLPEFEEACHEQGFRQSSEDIKTLFEGIDLDGAGLISKDEMIVLEHDPEERRDMKKVLELEKDEERKQVLTRLYQQFRTEDRPGHHRLARRGWHTDFTQMHEEVLRQRQQWRHKAQEDTMNAVALFRQHVRSTFGNEVRAWRRALDSEGKHRISRQRLLCYCRALNFSGSATALYRGLERDTDGAFGLEDFTPNHADILETFRSWAINSFGSCAKLWQTEPFQAAEKKGRLAMKVRGREFVHAALLLGYRNQSPTAAEVQRIKGNVDKISPENELKFVARGLDLNGCGFVRREDLEWLDGWNPPVWLRAKPNFTALQEFKGVLIEQYGTYIKAWRRCLDTDESNRVSWTEFQQACGKLHFRGDVAGAWRALDLDLSGLISLNELDPESHNLLVSFKHWSEKHFGSVGCAFRSLDRDESGSLTLSEIRKACKQLYWDGDPKQLFDALDMSNNPGELRRTIDFEEMAYLDGYNDDVSLHKTSDSASVFDSTSESWRSQTTSVTLCNQAPAYWGTRNAEELAVCQEICQSKPPKIEAIKRVASLPANLGFKKGLNPFDIGNVESKLISAYSSPQAVSASRKGSPGRHRVKKGQGPRRRRDPCANTSWHTVKSGAATMSQTM